MFKWFKSKVNNVVKVPRLSDANVDAVDKFMDKHENFRLGGPVAYMYEPKNEADKATVVVLASYRYEKYGHYNN